MIEKKLYYVWIGDAKKPDIFYKCEKSWKEKLPGYEIIEINEKNFDMKKHLNENRFFRECYERRLWAYVSDYIRVHFMYENTGIYLDTDMEILKDITSLIDELNTKKTNFFIGYEDEKHISVGIFGCDRHSEVLQKLIEFYKKDIWKKPLWTIPKIITHIFEKDYGLTEKRENKLKEGEIIIYPKEYFYPYHFTEKYLPECITKNTYGIHWWNDSWTTIKARLFLESKHLKGILKFIKKIKIIIRYYLIEKRK